MKTAFTKLPLLAGICLFFASSATAYSQGCRIYGYNGYRGGNHCQTYQGGGYGYNSCAPQYRNYSRGCSPRMQNNFNYGYRDQNQQFYQPSQTSSSATSYSSGAGVESRLSYVEAVVSFLLDKLGLLDDFEAFRNGSGTQHSYPQANRSAPGSDCST